MKHLIFLLFCFPISLSAQSWYQLHPYTTFFNFEDTANMPYLVIDTSFNSGTNWEIGAPQKVSFNAAFSSPNVIVTDTVNSYQVNDTSSFTIAIPLQLYATDYFLTGNYFVDCDTLNDFGKIEYSHDNGTTWVLISDDTTTFTNNGGAIVSFPPNYLGTALPVLTGKSNGWKNFHIDLLNTYNIFGMGNGPAEDTSLFKFTFISDSIAENRGGLMFDDIQIVNVFAFGLDDIDEQIVVLYPNPSNTSLLTIQNLDNLNKIEVYSNEGKLIRTEEGSELKTISVGNLPSGLYLLKLYNKKRVYSQKFIRN